MLKDGLMDGLMDVLVLVWVPLAAEAQLELRPSALRLMTRPSLWVTRLVMHTSSHTIHAWKKAARV